MTRLSMHKEFGALMDPRSSKATQQKIKEALASAIDSR